MSCRVVLWSRLLPRGKLVQVYLDLSAEGPKNHMMAVYQGPINRGDRRPYTRIVAFRDLTYSEALSWAEYQDQLPGPQPDSSWLAVLGRLMGRQEYQSWAGSAAEYATRYYPLGTWEWVQVLIAARSIRESRAAA